MSQRLNQAANAHPKRWDRETKSYVRQKPSIETKPILVVVEGEETEQTYLNLVKRLLKLKDVHLEIVHPEGTDPLTLVNYAIKQRKNRNAEDGEIWIMFDLERIHDERRQLAQKACELAKSNDIKTAISDPCFEFWLLLHCEYTAAPHDGCDEAIDKLKKYLPGGKYVKGKLPDSFVSERTIEKAAKAAQQIREMHQAAGSDANPSSDIDQLLISVNNLATEANQIKALSNK